MKQPDDPREFDFQRGDIVEVCWIDSASSHGWTDRQTEIDSPERIRASRCRSVGYVIEETDEAIVIAQSVTGGDMVSCCTTIPKFAITDRTRMLEETEEAAVE